MPVSNAEPTVAELKEQVAQTTKLNKELKMRLDLATFQEGLLQDQIDEDHRLKQHLREQLNEFETKEEKQLEEFERRIAEIKRVSDSNIEELRGSINLQRQQIEMRSSQQMLRVCQVNVGVQTCDDLQIDFRNIIPTKKSVLKRCIDPLCGLLDLLLEKGVMCHAELCSSVLRTKILLDVNDRLLQVIVAKEDEQFELFLRALADTEQQHVVNFFMNNGVIDSSLGDVRPLTDEEVSRIDCSRSSLVEMIILTELIDHLFQDGCITASQMERIMARSVPSDKTRELLDTIRRGSYASFNKFIGVLKVTHGHLTDVLEKGGVMLPTSVKLNKGSANQDKTKTELVAAFKKCVETSWVHNTKSLIPNLDSHKIRLVAVGNERRCKVYFYCGQEQATKILLELLLSGNLNVMVQTSINNLLHTKTITVLFNCNPSDYERCKEYFTRPVDDPWWPVLEDTSTEEADTFKNRLTLEYCIPGNTMPISGLTIFNDFIYVTHDASDEIHSYSLHTRTLEKKIKITIALVYHSKQRLLKPNPVDIASCVTHQCIYVCDGQNSCVLRLEPPQGKATNEPWRIDGEPRGISVNTEGQIVVSCFKNSELRLLHSDGTSLRQIHLVDSGIPLCPLHAIQIFDDEWLVSYQMLIGEKVSYGVCTVDEDGTLINCYGDAQSSDLGVSDELNLPLRLAIDMCGRSVVTDVCNHRMKLLSPRLENVRDVLTQSDIQSPATMVIHRELGLMFVGLKDGRIMVYFINNEL